MSHRQPGITGVTIIRDAVTLGYPLYYAVKSIIPACDRFIISEGYSEDDTLRIVRRLEKEYPRKMLVVQKEWPESLRGEAIAEITNDALSHCTTEWVYYVQADEIIHEANLDFVKAVPSSFRAYKSISFRFLHFRPTIGYVLKNPSYTYAIRMFQNHRSMTRNVLQSLLAALRGPMILHWAIDQVFSKSDVHSVGDGWTFQGRIHPILNAGRISEVRPIFHVGYVCKDISTLSRRARSHARNLFQADSTSKELISRISEWDGSPGALWDVVPYHELDYPILLRKWVETELTRDKKYD